MAILNFSDVLKNVGLDPKDVKLIRHALSDERFRECYKAGMAHEYTQHQKRRVQQRIFLLDHIHQRWRYIRETALLLSCQWFCA